jgi:hypothetical protein
MSPDRLRRSYSAPLCEEHPEGAYENRTAATGLLPVMVGPLDARERWWIGYCDE